MNDYSNIRNVFELKVKQIQLKQEIKLQKSKLDYDYLILKESLSPASVIAACFSKVQNLELLITSAVAGYKKAKEIIERLRDRE